MRRALLLLIICVLLPASASADMDSLELRKARGSTYKLGFAFIGLFEQELGLNRNRQEVTSLVYLAPQLKIGDKMRARLNFGFWGNWLSRQQNPWDLMDLQLQFSHLGFYKEKHSGIDFSGNVRYYVPISKQSRNEGSYGQLRGTGKLSRILFKDRLYLSFELNLQKYFHRYTTWNTSEPTGGSSGWYSYGAHDAVVENNANYGLGETFTATYSPVSGLDLTAIYGLYQSRQYGSSGASDLSGSSLVDTRNTVWNYSTRLILDVTVGLSALPWWKGSFFKEQMLSHTYLSLGYANLSPSLDPLTGKSHYTPFDPKYAYGYFDLMVMY
jgi:hypothetical protein